MNIIFIKKKFVYILTAFVLVIWIFGGYLVLSKTDIDQINPLNKKQTNPWSNSVEEETFVETWINKHRPLQEIPRLEGEMGKPVTLPDQLPPEIQKKIDDGWEKNSFNQYVSDLISVHRSLPDPRHEWCKFSERYSIKLPQTSVIICFHNEAWSVLLRSIHSVLNRSPPHLIKEIILVDDFSDMAHTKEPLKEYWANEPKIRILRTKRREGLIRARLIGTAHAKGEILTFLDSHIEAAPGWLEPLLDRIGNNYTTVVCPVIDGIHSTTLEYMYGPTVYVGGFDWNLLFTWHSIPDREVKRRFHEAEPVYSPTMAGGLFSISKKFFEELGTYDEGFDIWGAENLELSFKIWMCGGTLEIVPCSHVGHIFREKIPYKTSVGKSKESNLEKNLRRLSEVWLDDYKRFYYERIGKSNATMGDISSRIELRKNLGCKSFKWFLDNVYPELFVPDKIRGYGIIGANNLCIESWARSGNIYQPVPVQTCYSTSLGGAQFWYYSEKNEIRKDEYCLDYTDDTHGVLLYPCHGEFGTQQWDYQVDTGFFVNPRTNKCLRVKPDEQILELSQCDVGDLNQIWFLENFYKDR